MDGANKSLARYRSPEGIVLFVREILQAEPTDYQRRILATLVEKKRLAVHGPHGIGKTALAAWFTLWFLAVHERDVKVVTTASAWRQLTFYLWPEIRKWAERASWQQVGLSLRTGKEILEHSLRLPAAREAFAVASDNPSFIEGAHAANLAYVFDEAKAIPAATWDAAEGAFSTGNTYALAISTPGEQSGRFYEICARRPGYEDWAVLHVTLDDFLASGRVSREWIESRKRQWGVDSAIYQQRVLGQFADSSEAQLIPLSWVEAANERWQACEGQGPAEAKPVFGVDPAHLGPDQTAVARLRGSVIERVWTLSRQDTMRTVGFIKSLLAEADGAMIMVDTIGIGAGVVDRLRELNCQVRPVDARQKTSLRDSTGLNHFKNLRSALWWRLREALDPEQEEPLAVPPDDRLIGDLTAPTWTYTSTGAIEVESKDAIRKRLGRSPDLADAVCLALHASATPPLKIYDPLEW